MVDGLISPVFHLLIDVFSSVQVVLLKKIARSVWTPSKLSMDACVYWLWTTGHWTWSRCSRGWSETTVTCKSICAALLTGKTLKGPFATLIYVNVMYWVLLTSVSPFVQEKKRIILCNAFVVLTRIVRKEDSLALKCLILFSRLLCKPS